MADETRNAPHEIDGALVLDTPRPRLGIFSREAWPTSENFRDGQELVIWDTGEILVWRNARWNHKEWAATSDPVLVRAIRSLLSATTKSLTYLKGIADDIASALTVLWRIRDLLQGMSEVHYINVVPKVTAGAYSANDIVGGLLEFVGVPSGRLEAVKVSDLATQNVKYVLLLFWREPAAIADNGTFDIDDRDLGYIIPGGAIHIETADRTALTDSSVSAVSNLAVPIRPNNGKLWGYLYTTGAPTYAAVTDVEITLGIKRGG